jgi:hypothetical protein
MQPTKPRGAASKAEPKAETPDTYRRAVLAIVSWAEKCASQAKRKEAPTPAEKPSSLAGVGEQ